MDKTNFITHCSSHPPDSTRDPAFRRLNNKTDIYVLHIVMSGPSTSSGLAPVPSSRVQAIQPSPSIPATQLSVTYAQTPS